MMMKKEIKNMIKDRLNTLVSSADCKSVASGCVGSTPTLSTNLMPLVNWVAPAAVGAK